MVSGMMSGALDDIHVHFDRNLKQADTFQKLQFKVYKTL